MISMAMGKGKRKQQQDAIADRGSKRPQVDDAAIASSSNSSATLRNGGPGLHGSPEDATSDIHSLFEEPPPPQASTPSIEAQGEPPTTTTTTSQGSNWNFNLEASPGGAPGGTLTLPAVPMDWVILAALPSEEERAALPPEATVMGMIRCLQQHGWLREIRAELDFSSLQQR